MKKYLLTAAVILLGTSFAAGDANAHNYEKLCETIPSGSSQGNFIATDDEKLSNYVATGGTSGFLEGRNNRYLVNQHNGEPIVFTDNCEGKMVADTGPRLKGLLITTPYHFRGKMGGIFNEPGFFLRDLSILTVDPSIQAHMSNYNQEIIDQDLLNDIIRDTVVFMRDKNQPVVDVYFPEQDVTDGYIVALVKRAVIEDIIVNGNEYYSDEEILKFNNSEPNEYIWSDTLSRDLRWINSYPYRQVDVIFKPGENPGYTDVIYETKDMNPARIFGGIDNYGSPTTNEHQAYLGFSYGDLWDLDHEVIYSFGSSLDFANFNSHTLQYIVPFDWRHRLSLTGNISTSKPEATGLISQEGTNMTLNVDYEMPLYDWGFRGFTQAVNIGTDYKRLENDLEFGGINVFSGAPEILQHYVTYEGTRASAKTVDTLRATLIGSLGGITGNNTDADFNTSRVNADSSYTYGRGLYEKRYTDPTTNLTFSALFRGQYSPDQLLSSEQIALSGPGSVRGFDSNAVRRDIGYVGTLEVASPYIPVIDYFLSDIFRDRLQGFVFYDRAEGKNVTDSTTARNGVILQSIGLGARFGISNNINGVVEYGRELGDEFDDGPDDRVHFRLNAAY